MCSITLPNSFFTVAASCLREGAKVHLTVLGESMYPFIHSGDSIVLLPYHGEDLPLYTAVFFQWEGSYMIHRIIKKESSMWHMQGDGNIYRVESLPPAEIIGVLVQYERPDGRAIDSTSDRWIRQGKLWYKLRPIRKYLLKLLRWVQ